MKPMKKAVVRLKRLKILPVNMKTNHDDHVVESYLYGSGTAVCLENLQFKHENLEDLFTEHQQMIETAIASGGIMPKILSKRKHIAGNGTTLENKSKNNNFTCNVCNTSFTRRTLLDMHLITHRKPPFECDLCIGNFKQLRTLQQHKRIAHSGGDAISCAQCHNKFSNYTALRYHKLTVHKGTNFICTLCYAEFSSRDSLRRHIAKHNKNLFECDQCNACFSVKLSLLRHLKIHKGETFDCTICNMKFSTYNRLKRHNDSHFEKEFNCVKCNKEFSNIRDFRTHQRMVHPFECRECNTKCRTSYHLRSREQIHLRRTKSLREQNDICDAQKPPFQCLHCDSMFPEKSDLMHYLEKHRIKTFDCDKCNLKFNTISDLRYHKSEQLKCDQCNTKFCNDQNFEKHLKKHTKNKSLQIDSLRHQKLCQKFLLNDLGKSCKRCGSDCPEKDIYLFGNREICKFSYKCEECGSTFWSRVTFHLPTVD